MTSYFLATLDRAAAPLRPADRPARAQRQVRRLRRLGVGRPAHPRLHRRRRRPRSTPTSSSGWTGRRRRVELPAGRYETLLPPSAVADLMLYAYWGRVGPRRRGGPQRLRRAGGGTRIGERLAPLPLTLRSDPAEPGLQCAPFEIVTPSGGGLQSVFDNGCPVGRPTGSATGTLTNLVRTRAWAARTGRAAAPARRQPDPRRRRHRAPLEDMIARTERGLLLTCLWYIREVDPQTLLLTGLTRDGVYLVEDGEVSGGGEQLPLQRVADRPARPGYRGRPHRADAAARVERLLHPRCRCRPCGCPTSTCRRSARPPDPPKPALSCSLHQMSLVCIRHRR